MNTPFAPRSIACPRCGLDYLYDPAGLARCPTCCDGPMDWARDRLEAADHLHRSSREDHSHCQSKSANRTAWAEPVTALSPSSARPGSLACLSVARSFPS